MTGEIVTRIIKALERYYEAAPAFSGEDIGAFLRTHDDHQGREVLLVREEDDELELLLVLPKKLAQGNWQTLSLDERCQVVEGASHFLMVCERARRERSTTQLELELQAEVDKWLILSNGGRLDPETDVRLRGALYEEGEFVHDEATPVGERYRLANSLAARFVHRLSTSYARQGRFSEMREELLRFFHMGQEEKLRFV